MNRSHAPAFLVLAAGLAAPAYAQVLMPETTRWTLPDFDQRRNGLANSGNNHCVPTSHANMLAYIGDHGFNLVFPNVTKSSWASEYQDITNNIFTLGMDMGTTGSGGTNGQGTKDGMATWLGGFQFLFNITYLNGPSVTPANIYFNGLGNGLVAVCYGRWEYISANSRYERTGGGHCITVRGMKNLYFPFTNGHQPILKYRDPASDDGNLFQQSTYATTSYNLRPFTANFKGYGNVTMWEMVTNSGDQYRRCLDGFTAIHPIFVLQPDLSNSSLHISTIVNFVDSQSQGGFDLANIQDFGFGMLPHNVFAVGNFNSDFSRVVLGNALAGGISHQVLLPGTGGKVAPGREGEVFVITGSSLRKMLPNDDGGMDEGAGPLALGGAVDCMVFDDIRNGPTILMGDGSVREYDKALGGLVTRTLATSPGWPVTTGAGHHRIIPGNTPGDYWFGPLQNGQFKRYTPAPGAPTRLVLTETVTPPAGDTPTDFDLNDLDELILKRNGILQVLKRNIGGAGGWIIDTANPFNGLAMPGGGHLHLSRSRNNFNPEIQVGPEWSLDEPNPQPLGPEVPDCIADFGRAGGISEPDGMLDNNDFIAFINQFFALDERADIGTTAGFFGHDSRFDNNDFISFINLFFNGCPQ
ncbi:MAG: GC-type dockerin domain-anchored protein [Phycisphaerales bacterium]